MATTRRALMGASLVLAAIPAAASALPASQPDAALIALCEEFIALDRAILQAGLEDDNFVWGTAAQRTHLARTHAMVDRSHELKAEIATLAATTPAGLRALVQAARHSISVDADRVAVDLLDDTEVAWAALDSVLAMLGNGAIT